MKGIIGRKVGMTQLFDEDTGDVTAVTVIEAGPVSGCAGPDSWSATATRLRNSRSARFPSGRSPGASSGHLKRNGFGPHRDLVEFRGPTELGEGDTVTVEAFEPGDAVKVSGVSIGKGFQGTIKRHNFSSGPKSHGSRNIRAPGSIGASAWPARVFKGQRMPGRMGARARDAARACASLSATWRRTSCLCRAPFPAPATASSS